MARSLARTLALQSAVTGTGFARVALFLAGDAPVVSSALWKATLALFLVAVVVAGIAAND